METRLRIKGMTCAGCGMRVQKALHGVRGVDHAVVDLGQKEARVVWDDETGTTRSLEALIHAVHQAGYGATLLESETKNAWSLALTLGLPVTVFLMIAEWGFHADHRSWYAPFAFFVTLPVIAAVGGQFYASALRQLSRGRLTMDTLVTLGSLSAWGLSVYGWLRPGRIYHPYFMEAAAIVSLIGIGHWLEGRIFRRANATLRQLLTLAPPWARRFLPSGEEEEVRLSELALGDLLLIKPGDHIPIDGEVCENHGAIDESLLTGESKPVEKGPGSPVYAGTLNVSHRLIIRVTGMGAETALARVIAAVERAQGTRAAIETLVDRVSRIFVLLVLVLAALTVVGWIHAGVSLEQALVTAVSVLIVACPCALGLATPAALMAATNAGARRGVLFRDAAALEKCGRITTVLFDKTGTLTEAVAAVERVQILTHRLGKEEFAALARALASASTHPASRSAAAHFSYAAQIKLDECREVSGAGVSGVYQNEVARLGSMAWLREAGVFIPAQPSTAGADLGISLGHELIGIVSFNPHRPRPEAARVLRALREAGLEIGMVSGDTHRAAVELAERVGISEERVFAPVPPPEKAELVARLQGEGRRVAFVGDGINDGPALAQADLGIAVMEASDLAREAADVVLLHRENDLQALPEVIALAAATRRVIVQNLAWALVYNVALIPLAMAGAVPPIAAAAAMGVSDLCVMANAWRLSRWKGKPLK